MVGPAPQSPETGCLDVYKSTNGWRLALAETRRETSMSKPFARMALKQAVAADKADLDRAIKSHGAGSKKHIAIALKILRRAINSCE